MKKRLMLSLSVILIFLLSGCLFPAEELAQNQIPNDAQLAMVQTAINQYQEEQQGLLPIKTVPEDTPIFEKYIIDFDTLKSKNYLSELPGNSFERGGYFKYALTDVETNPTVKLIDVRSSQKLQDVYMKLHFYLKNKSYLPLKKNISGKYFEIDFKKLGYKEDQYVESPYSGQQLPIIMDNEGQVYIDYRVDLHNEIQEHDYTEYKDIRYILVDHNPFLPVYSPKYKIEENYPILADKED